VENKIDKIETNKNQILPILYEWAETFEWELDDDGERTHESYNIVFELAERLENNVCSISDYKEIEFHISQINYNEEQIKL